MSEQPYSRSDDESSSAQLKALIITWVQEKAFDCNPLLSTTHFITCHHCKHRQSVVYLDSLKSGDFEVGKPEQIEVLDTSGPMSFLKQEKVTSIIFSFLCQKCGYHIELRPISVEYLQVVIERPQTLGTMYV